MLVEKFHSDTLLVALESVQLEGKKLVVINIIDKLALSHFIFFLALPKAHAIFFFIPGVKDRGSIRLV